MLHGFSYLRADIPHLDSKNIKLDTLVRERFIAESLAGSANTFFKALVNPQSEVTVTIPILATSTNKSTMKVTYSPPRLRNPVSQNII
jgi:hypothetical protein